MKEFIGFAELARWIRETRPAGSFSALVDTTLMAVNGCVNRVQWSKGELTRDLNGQFMTWARTGGIVVRVSQQ